MGELQGIIQTINDAFEGEAWHGPNVIASLSKIPENKVNDRIGNSHSIIELVSHIVSWRNFVLEKLKDNLTYDVTDEMNFPSSSSWPEALMNLQESQGDLLAALSSFDEKRLHTIVPGRKYTYYKLLHGIVHHDLYHLGQIVMISKQL